MIVRVTHDPDRGGFRVVADKDRTFTQDGPEVSDYFPPNVLAATREPGSVAYFEAEKSAEGDLTFGAASTVEAFEGA